MFKYVHIAILGLVVAASAAGLTKLQVEFSGIGNDHSCDSSAKSVRSVGAVSDILVTILPDGKRLAQVEYTGVSDWTWPAGLVIEAGQASHEGEPFRPSKAIREQLDLRYYVTDLQAQSDSIWRATGLLPDPIARAPQYFISFRALAELADSFLCITAHWKHPKYGDLSAEQPLYAKIVVPCSEKAQHRVWTTQVVAATHHKDYQQAIMLADSFINLGWHSVRGLRWALMAAVRTGRYDDALRFNDVCFETNHTVSFRRESMNLSAPTESDRHEYEMTRSKLMERKRQQEEQQR
jgi:hypothetical protein